MDALKTEIETRWRRIFAVLEAGDDVSPTLRLRAEGMMEAATLLGIASADELAQAMDSIYQAATGRRFAQDYGEEWRSFYPFPQIPATGKRAPVYPSTSD